MRSTGRAGLLASAMLMLAAAGEMPTATLTARPQKANYKPPRQRLDTALQREIAEHNAAVDARKAAKRARKAAASEPRNGEQR